MTPSRNVLTVLNEIQFLVNSQPELKSKITLIIDHSRNLLNFNSCVVLLKNDSNLQNYSVFQLPENSINIESINQNKYLDTIITRGETVLSNKITSENLFITINQTEKTIIGIPLKIDNKIVGAYFLLSNQKNAFSNPDLLLMENLAGIIVSSVIQNNVRDMTLSQFKEASKDINLEFRDINKTMDKIIQWALNFSEADHACLLKYCEEQGHLECRFPTGCSINKKRCVCRLDETDKLISYVYKNNKAEKIDNIRTEGYISHINYFNNQEIISQAAVPLFYESNQLLGVLITESTIESYFTKDHLARLTTLSEISAIAFRTSNRITKLEKLSEAGDVLLKDYEKKTLKEKYAFIVEKTIKILDAELCSLFLVENDLIYLKTSYSYENNLVKKREFENVRLEIKSGLRTGITGAIAYEKAVYNKFGQEHQNHPAMKNPAEAQFIPSGYCYSELAYPMLDENKELLGILIVYNKLDKTGKPLTDTGFSKEFDEQLMKILTTKLIISIKNAQLLNQLKNYEMIVETTPDPVVKTTKNGLINYMNEGAINLFGDLRGKNVSDYYFSDQTSTGYQKAIGIMRKLLKSTDSHLKNFETVFTSRNGEPLPLSIALSLLKNTKGEIIGTIGIAKDLREIKTLLDVGNSLLATHEIDKILKKICDECLKLPKSNRAYIELYDEKSDHLYFRELSSRNSGDELPKEPNPKDRGMTGLVFTKQEYCLSDDVTKEPSEKYHNIFPNVTSKIVVPISSINKENREIKKMGVLSVDSAEKHAFTINDAHFLSTLANQAASALETANLFTYKNRIINELSALEKVRKTITETSNIDEILESLLDSVTDTLGFDYATISEVIKDKGMIGVVRNRNVPTGWVEDAWHSLDSKDIQAWVVKNKKEQKLCGWDERIDQEMYEKYNQKKLARIYIPIITRGEVLGTLETGYYKTHKPDIEPEEVEILRKIVNLAGLGIEQVKLVNEQANLVKRLKSDIELRNILENQLHALNQASINIQYSSTEEEAINYIFMSLESIGYNKGMVSLVIEETDMIEGRYALGDNWKAIMPLTRRSLKSNDILAVAVRRKKPILIKDCNEDIRCDKAAIQAGNINSQYIIPLMVNDVGIGTLQIDLTDKPELVQGDEHELNQRMRVLDTFANQSAIAIRNIRDIGTIDFLETSLAETAHEFRSPLHNIMTQLGGLKDYLEFKYQKQENEIEKIVMSITEEVYRAKRQMENTLLLSDKSKKLMGYHFEVGLVQKIIEHVVSSFQVRAITRSIKIIIKDNVFKLPEIVLDKQKIEQVITNLIDNAVKYSNFDRKIYISGVDLGKKIQIDVADRGLGIPENERENIFKGFTRSEFKDKTRYIPGTGIGLKISNEIVEGHGGSITVKSNPAVQHKQGWYEYMDYDTVFSVILPKRPKEGRHEG
jgi:PAS domain S-box-containing protein